MKNNKYLHYFIIGTFVSLYAIVSIISTIHVINFFDLSNPHWLAVSLAIAFEIGAAASLSSIIVLDKVNKSLVWFLFILLTSFQMMGNSYYAYTNLDKFQGWIELFGLVDKDLIFQKRILSVISGAILPLVALGFIKSLVDYIKPSEENAKDPIEDAVKEIQDNTELINNYENQLKDLQEQLKVAEAKPIEIKNEVDIKAYEQKIEDLTKKLEIEKNKTSFEKSLDETKMELHETKAELVKAKQELHNHKNKPTETVVEINPDFSPRKVIYEKKDPHSSM